MMKQLSLVGLIFLMGASEKPLASVILKNGREVKIYSEPTLEKNMLAILDKKGRKIMISKGLIDWKSTREKTPSLYVLAYPDKAKVWLANRKNEKKPISKPKQRIVITNDTLNELNPDEGLASEWAGEPVAMDSQGKPLAKKVSGPIIKTIARGDRIDIKSHMEKGRYVVFDFYAKWCGPCRQLTPQLERMVKRYPDRIALKKVDIIKWGTPVASQFNIRSIPYLEVYNDRGKQTMKGNGFRVLKDLEKKARKEKW